MTGKERIRATIERRGTDCVPLGFYAVDHEIVSKVLGRATYVRDKIARKVLLWEGRRDELAASYKTDTVEFYRKIDCADIILPKEAPELPPADYTPPDPPPKKIEQNKWQDNRGRIWQAVPEVNEIQCIHDPVRKTEFTVDDFAGPVEVAPPDESCYEAIDYLIEQLGADRYVCSKCPITALTREGDTASGLMMYALDPEVVHAANRRHVAQQNQLDKYNIRPGSAGVFVEEDMAGTNGPLISPQMFREMCLPYLARRIEHIRQFTDQVGMHNCGNNIPLMEMFIEAGIDYYQSLQTTAGMEIGRLKEMFGEKLVFWGGVALEVLIQGEPDDVRKEVRTAMQRGAPGGGFILGPSHSIAMGTKYDNFMAMIDEYIKLRDKF